jgi:uncharacterized UPF0160 family protein
MKLYEKLSSILKNKVVIFDFKKEKMVNSSLISKGKRVEIILDNQHISFRNCIKIIETLKEKSITFKIFPKNASFIIGSNSRNDKGQTIKIE